MKKNIGTADRFVRVMLGVIAIILGLSGILEGNLKWIALIVACIMVLTAIAISIAFISESHKYNVIIRGKR